MKNPANIYANFGPEFVAGNGLGQNYIYMVGP